MTSESILHFLRARLDTLKTFGLLVVVFFFSALLLLHSQQKGDQRSYSYICPRPAEQSQSCFIFCHLCFPAAKLGTHLMCLLDVLGGFLGGFKNPLEILL